MTTIDDLTQEDYDRIEEFAHDDDGEGFDEYVQGRPLHVRMRAWAAWVFDHPEPPDADEVCAKLNSFANELEGNGPL